MNYAEINMRRDALAHAASSARIPWLTPSWGWAYASGYDLWFQINGEWRHVTSASIPPGAQRFPGEPVFGPRVGIVDRWRVQWGRLGKYCIRHQAAGTEAEADCYRRTRADAVAYVRKRLVQLASRPRGPSDPKLFEIVNDTGKVVATIHVPETPESREFAMPKPEADSTRDTSSSGALPRIGRTFLAIPAMSDPRKHFSES